MRQLLAIVVLLVVFGIMMEENLSFTIVDGCVGLCRERLCHYRAGKTFLRPAKISDKSSEKGLQYNHNSSSSKNTSVTKIDEGDDEQDVDIDDLLLSSVSDAEALLACRAHLQRTNQLDDWKNGEFRKLQKRRRQNEGGAYPNDDSTGFFWDNPDELVYYNRRKRPNYSSTTSSKRSDGSDDNQIIISGKNKYRTIEGTEYAIELPNNKNDDENEDDEEIWESIGSSRSSLVPRQIDQDDDDEDDFWENEHFSSSSNGDASGVYYYARSYYILDDVTPSESHTHRSNAAKRRFANPEWKAKWYQKRWGSKNNTESSNKQRRRQLEERIRRYKLDEFLQHPELNKMTEREIAQAIQTYVKANQKRAATLRKTMQQRRNALQESFDIAVQNNATSAAASELLSRDSLFQVNTTKLKEQRQKRSEQATRAFQQRRLRQKDEMDNHKRKETTRRKARHPKSAALTPEAALERLQIALDDWEATLATFNYTQLESDVQLLLQPTQLAHRKNVLGRILSECFGLQGKCVPISIPGGNKDDITLQFVRQSTIADLGAFVLAKIRQRKMPT